MNFALLLQHKLWQSANQIWALIWPAPPVPLPTQNYRTHTARTASLMAKDKAAAQHNRLSVEPTAGSTCKKHLPLRVRHVLECGTPRGPSGRYVISGRMADVCAELDRLAAKEAAMH